MERYRIIRPIGSGAFGDVIKGVSKETDQVVAIKRMKETYKHWDECLQQREIRSLSRLRHPNVVRMIEAIRQKETLYLVFEYCPDGSLVNLLEKRERPLPETTIRNIMWQMLQGLAAIHMAGFMHRDIKPDNIFITGFREGTVGGPSVGVVKIGDFGLCREARARPGTLTDYVSTRWYRAPEVLLHMTPYSQPVDMWAAGCILAEMYLLRPLWPGTSEIDQILKIVSTLGPPTQQNWPEGVRLATKLGIRFQPSQPISLTTILPEASSEAVDLASHLLTLNPSQRYTASQALNHPFFTKYIRLPPKIQGKEGTPLSRAASASQDITRTPTMQTPPASGSTNPSRPTSSVAPISSRTAESLSAAKELLAAARKR